MTVEEGFARRWSRLKRQGAPPPPAVQAPEAVPEPVVEPPPADSIPLEEIAVWLKRRVPDLWRQAALRRLWTSDPMIRDFIGPADYAWDWNTPGAAPGWGPMRAVDDIAKLLARAIGEPLPPPPAPPVSPASPPPDLVAERVPVPVESGPEPAPSAPEPAPESPMLRRGGRATPV